MASTEQGGAAAPPGEHDLGDVLMRRWRPADAPALRDAVTRNVEHLRPWMPWVAAEPMEPAAREELLGRWERQWDAGEQYTYGLFDGARVVGSAGLMRRIGPGGMDIGYWVDAGRTRQGLATRAAAALTGFAFSQPSVDRVEIHHDRANVASGRVPDKLGYTLVDTRPDEVTAPGESGFLCVWRVTREGWRP